MTSRAVHLSDVSTTRDGCHDQHSVRRAPSRRSRARQCVPWQKEASQKEACRDKLLTYEDSLNAAFAEAVRRDDAWSAQGESSAEGEQDDGVDEEEEETDEEDMVEDLDYERDGNKYLAARIVGVSFADAARPHGWYAFDAWHDELRSSYAGMVALYAALARAMGYPGAEEGAGRLTTSEEDAHTLKSVYNRARSGPFYELISFSPGEGVIGTRVVRKLARDFKRLKRHVLEKLAYDPQLIVQYKDLARVFRKAAQLGGLIMYN